MAARTWTHQQLSYLGSPAFLNSLDFNGQTLNGIAVGVGETWNTVDGATWSRGFISPNPGELRSVAMLGSNDAWAVGQQGGIYRTASGGSTFFEQTDGLSVYLNGVSAIFSPGQTPTSPFSPAGAQNPTHKSFPFNNVPGNGFWFDPAVASYLLKTDGVSKFTKVGLPPLSIVPDADGLYQITSSLGTVTVGAGSFYTFPSPVTQFTITGINPRVEGSNPLAFPLNLTFNQSSVNFTMTPVPEPTTVVLVACSLMLLALRIRRRLAGKVSG
jgi:hypothetical protein